MIEITSRGYGRLSIGDDPVVVISTLQPSTLLCCRSGRNVWVAFDDYIEAIMLPAGQVVAAREIVHGSTNLLADVHTGA